MKECKFCSGEGYFLLTKEICISESFTNAKLRNQIYVTIHNGYLKLLADDEVNIEEIAISFCPICGRKLICL